VRITPLRGVIERRLLVNYRLDPDVAKDVLPAPLQARLIGGYAVAVIALAHLGRLRPAGLPAAAGLSRESAMHGIAVEWESPRSLHTGVFVVHRDSVGVGTGRLVRGGPRFSVDERIDGLRVAYTSRDRIVHVDVDVSLAPGLAGSALFRDVRAAARFLELDGAGGAAWGPALRGLKASAGDGCVSPARVRMATSSIFADTSVFPPGSMHLDSALLLRDIAVAPAPAPAPATPPADRVRGARRAAPNLA
jgi:hypothetical protein